MAEYDIIAKDYARINAGRPIYRYAIYPAFFKMVGNVKNKCVIDLACGEGIVAREMARQGAGLVVGVDTSGEMLTIARSKGTPGVEIDYRLGKVGSLKRIAGFDIATGSFLLHYAKSRRELTAMCRNIADNLEMGGVFYGINQNPLSPLCNIPEYDNFVEGVEPLREGDKLRVHYKVEATEVEFFNYFWHWSTYEQLLSEAGFVVDWMKIWPTEEGVRVMGEQFWESFIMQPQLMMLRCTKTRQ